MAQSLEEGDGIATTKNPAMMRRVGSILKSRPKDQTCLLDERVRRRTQEH